MNNKEWEAVKARDKRRVYILALLLGVGTGVIGSFVTTLVNTGDVWIVFCLIAAAIAEGFLLGKIINLRVPRK